MLLGDVGGQRTLRPYWRNYFEQTDALVWVVDSSDRMRIEDCKHELHSLLTEDVRENVYSMFNFYGLITSCFSDWRGRLCLYLPTKRICLVL
jgi:hypothetical protein